RRNLLRGLGVGLAGLAVAPVVAACGGAAPTATTAPAVAPTKPAASAAPSAAPAAGGAASSAPSAAPAGATASTTSTYTPPAIPSGSHKLAILQWAHFVPAYDEYFDKYAQDWGKQNNVQVTVDHVPTDTVVTQASAEVAANAGHDLTEVENTPDPVVFADKTLDVSTLA